MLISHNNLSGKTLNESYRLNRPERKTDETIREDYAASIPVTPNQCEICNAARDFNHILRHSRKNSSWQL